MDAPKIKPLTSKGCGLGRTNMRRNTLAGLSLSLLVGFASTEASAFFDYQKLARMDAKISLMDACDDAVFGTSTYKEPLSVTLQRIANQNGVPEGEYDIVIDPKWGPNRALLVSREDLILKPKPQAEKVIRGQKVKLVQAPLSQEFMDEWNKAFDSGFKYAALIPYSKGTKPAKPTPFAMLVDLPAGYNPDLRPHDINDSSLVKVLSLDFAKTVVVKSVNLRFKNADGRWNSFSRPSRDALAPVGEIQVKEKPKAAPAVTKGR